MSTKVTGIKVEVKKGKKFEVNIERYNSADEVVRDCKSRSIHDYDDMSQKNMKMTFEHVHDYDEALRLLKDGYQPTVETLATALKMNISGERKRVKFQNNVAGFQPIVPLALQGVPNCMVNTYIKPMKCKVVDIYYDMGCPFYVESEDIIKAGQKLLASIIELEKQGYKFNLYATQGYSDESGVDFLTIKVKSSDKPLDLKRISFPLTHPAFFRVIGFDWQSKSPVSNFRGSGRGQAITSRFEKTDVENIVKNAFGNNSVYLAANKIREKDEEYIKEVLVNAENNNKK